MCDDHVTQSTIYSYIGPNIPSNSKHTLNNSNFVAFDIYIIVDKEQGTRVI